MNRIRLTTMIAIASLAVCPLFAVNFGSPDVNAGDTWTETSSYGSDLTLTIDNGMGLGNAHNATLLPTQAHQQTSIARSKNVKVTDVNGSKIAGLEVEYTSVILNGIDSTTMFAGKHYAIDINSNHVGGVTYADGTTPSDSEVTFVKSDNSNVGQAREMRRVFGGQSVDIGDMLRSHNPDDLFDVQSGFTIDDFSMTLASVDGAGADQVATFTVVLSISGEGVKKHKSDPPDAGAPFSSSSVHMTLSGPLRANVSTGRIIDFNFSGPATASGQKEAKGHDSHGNEISGKKGKNNQARQMTVSGNGTASMSASFAY